MRIRILAVCGLMMAAALGSGFAPVHVAAMPEPELVPLEIASPSAMLMDAGTGQVLCEYNADTRMHPAGAAKVMTMLVVAESMAEGRLSDDVAIQVSEKAASTGGTQAFLDAGKSYGLTQLLEGMCIASANDASVALAEASYGSEEAFVAQMNKRAAELGCENTLFENCSGIYTQGAYTTARDLAKISAELSGHRRMTEFTSIFLGKTIHPDGRETELNNSNRMVRFYEGADGFATGSSPESKYACSVTARRGDMRLICVVLGAQDSTTRFADAQQMLDYGFANYSSRVVVKQGEILRKNVPVEKGAPREIDVEAFEELRLLVRKGDEKNIRKELELAEVIAPPIVQGAQVGTLNIYVNEELVATVPAVASANVNELSVGEAVRVIVRRWVTG